MIKLGLIGYPVGHSLSPRIHKAALEACALEGEYSLYPILPDDLQALENLLGRVRSCEITGLNVTIPHKQNVIQFLDELTPTAEIIGAVNTIYLRNEKLVGDNTDAPGFLSDLKRFLTRETQSYGDLNALVLGAGGSARAIVYALLKDGWKITLAARSFQQAQYLANSFTNYQSPISALTLSNIKADTSNLQSLLSTLSLIINTTPLGMSPNIDQSPWPENFPFPPQAAIYDLVYNPRQTKLVADARAQGLPATTGLGMLVEQAALSFKIWTGYDPSRAIMFESIKQSSMSDF